MMDKISAGIFEVEKAIQGIDDVLFKHGKVLLISNPARVTELQGQKNSLQERHTRLLQLSQAFFSHFSQAASSQAAAAAEQQQNNDTPHLP